MRDVTAIGPLNIDLIMWGDGPTDWQSIPVWDGPAGMEMVAAGSVGYTARDFARLGLNVKVVGCVPQDALGTFIIENLRQDGVDTGGMQQVPDSTAGIGAYMLLFGSRKRPLAYRLPSHDPWPEEFSTVEIDDLLDTRLIHNGGYLHFEKMYGGALDDIFREARCRGVLTSMDPQFPLFAMQGNWIKPLAGVLPFVDIFLCDDHEAGHITGTTDLNEAARVLLDAGPEIVVIKMGVEGASIYEKGRHFHQTAIKVGDLVDSIGAGDAFDASFLYATLQG